MKKTGLFTILLPLLLLSILPLHATVPKEKTPDDAIIAAIFLHNLGVTSHNKKEYNAAIQYFQQALDIYKQRYGDEPHPHIEKCLNNLGITYYHKGEYDTAIQYFQQALNIVDPHTTHTKR